MKWIRIFRSEFQRAKTHRYWSDSLTTIYCAHFILTCVFRPPYLRSFKMQKINFYDKLMKFEEYKYSMYLMLKEKPMSIPDILEFFPLTRSATQNMIEAFVVKSHLTFFMGTNPKTGRKLKIYKYGSSKTSSH